MSAYIRALAKLSPRDNPVYSHRMLHVLVRPVLVPSIMMHSKSIDNALLIKSAELADIRVPGTPPTTHPDHYHPAIDIFLTLSSSFQPICADYQHDDHDARVGDLSRNCPQLSITNSKSETGGPLTKALPIILQNAIHDQITSMNSDLPTLYSPVSLCNATILSSAQPSSSNSTLKID